MKEKDMCWCALTEDGVPCVGILDSLIQGLFVLS